VIGSRACRRVARRDWAREKSFEMDPWFFEAQPQLS
jgi:hypothetical protein